MIAARIPARFRSNSAAASDGFWFIRLAFLSMFLTLHCDRFYHFERRADCQLLPGRLGP
jgi:hypothetical protein